MRRFLSVVLRRFLTKQLVQRLKQAAKGAGSREVSIVLYVAAAVLTVILTLASGSSETPLDFTQYWVV